MRLRNYLAVGCLAFWALSAQAETLSSLYQVREPVEGQGAEARAQATGKALETLVLRLTGDPKAVQSPALAALRKDPQQIISKFGFEAELADDLLRILAQRRQGRALHRLGIAGQAQHEGLQGFSGGLGPGFGALALDRFADLIQA